MSRETRTVGSVPGSRSAGAYGLNWGAVKPSSDVLLGPHMCMIEKSYCRYENVV